MTHIVLGTLLLEGVTIVMRMFFGANTKKKHFPFYIGEYRWHHGYTGILCLFIPVPFFFELGMVLLFSDVIHHFIVLPLWVGRFEFPE